MLLSNLSRFLSFSFFTITLICFLVFVSSALAQETVENPSIQPLKSINTLNNLSARIESLEKNIQDLSRSIFKVNPDGDNQSGTSKSTNLNVSDPFTQRMTANELRMSNLETELRRLTGVVETAANDVRLVGERIDKLVEDLDIRLLSLEKNIEKLGSTNSVKQGSYGNLQKNSSSNTENLATENNDKNDIQSIKTENQISSLPKTTPEEQYAYARSLLLKLDYQSAEIAFQEFIALNKQHKLSSNAYYWLGEGFYVRKNFAEAAGAFIDSYKLFPSGNKAPDSLLKLGMSLSELGNKDEACESFAELLMKFPETNSRLRRRAMQESVKVGCKN